MKPDPATEMIANFYCGLRAQKIPKDVATELTREWIRIMLGTALANKQPSADGIIQWLKSQEIPKES